MKVSLHSPAPLLHLVPPPSPLTSPVGSIARFQETLKKDEPHWVVSHDEVLFKKKIGEGSAAAVYQGTGDSRAASFIPPISTRP